MTKKSIQLISNTLFMYIRMYSISGMLTTATRRVPLADKDFPNVPKRLNSPPPPFFLSDSCYSIFSFMCMFCRSLFVLLYFFFWPLYCLFFFDKRILITPVLSFGHCVVCSSSTNGF
jgi:hypothetical protein